MKGFSIEDLIKCGNLAGLPIQETLGSGNH